MEKTVIENHERYRERINLYKKFSYDIEEERRFIIEKARPFNGKILEVGTGKGYLTIALARAGYDFTSIDISGEEQEFARLNIKYFGLDKKVDFKIADAGHSGFKNKTFGVIFSVNLLHHLLNPFKVMDELIRIVSFNGKIVLSDFSKEGLQVVDKIHETEGRKHEVSQANLNDMANYLLDKSFKIERHRTEFQETLIASLKLAA